MRPLRLVPIAAALGLALTPSGAVAAGSTAPAQVFSPNPPAR